MTTKTIKIADDFSKFPGGRYVLDGPASGEEFRNDHLIPALKVADRVIVNFDGVAGYAASFLEEAFGGAVIELGLEFVKRRLVIDVSDDPNLSLIVQNFMNKAAVSVGN